MKVRQKALHLFIVTALIVTALIVSACSTQSKTQNVEKGSEKAKTVTIGNQIGIDSINPYAHSALSAYGDWRHVYEPLVSYDFKKKEYYGVLAESWKVENKTNWIFNLRKGVKFHDGSEFTADDVIHSFTRIKEDKESLQGNLLSNVEKMEKVDSHTVKIITKVPSVSFLKELYWLYITSKSVYDQHGAKGADKLAIGTGPYKFKNWVRGERFVIEANPDYWGGKPTVDQLVFRTMPEDVARVTALEKGEVDIITAPLQDLKRLEKNPNIKVESVPSFRMMMFVLNQAIKPLDNKKVRQAINYAINVESIINNVLDGHVKRLNGPVADYVVGNDPSWSPYPYDPDKARQLLKEAGFPNGFDLVVYSTTERYPRDVNVGEAVVSQLKEVGIRAKLETPEWGLYSNNYQKGAYGMYYMGRGPVFDADILLRQYFRTGVTKRTSYSNPTFDQLLDKAETLFDDKERTKVLQEAGTLLSEDAASVFMYAGIDDYAFSKNIDWHPRADEQILVGFPASTIR